MSAFSIDQSEGGWNTQSCAHAFLDWYWFFFLLLFLFDLEQKDYFSEALETHGHI